jgi:uncharacterized protein (TIGR03118 family)
MTAFKKLQHLNLVAILSLTVTTSISSFANDQPEKANHYVQNNLVSDLPGVALLQDTNLVNAWGMSFSPGTPFWISDNGTGKATLYTVTNDASGQEVVVKNPLEVTIPGEGNPTGQVFNNTTGFHGDLFLFVSEDGTLSGWRPALGATAEVLTNRAGAVYKGTTLATLAGAPVLLAANFAEAKVDVFDTNANLVAQISDADAPAGFAPFNVQNIQGMVFVTFALQDDARHDDVAGRGHGLIDVLDTETGQLHRFATGSAAGGKVKEMDSPWGLALAPSTFGRHSGELLVGNFGSGTIMSFDAGGEFQGLLKGEHGRLVIQGLWALAFGNGTRAGDTDTLFFTAGPDDESHGLFGSIRPLVKERN